MIGFVAVAFVVVGLLHLYLWRRLVRDPLRPGRARRAGGIVAVLLAVLVPATMIGARSQAAPWLAWPGFIWLALMFYLFVTLLVLEVPRLVLGRVLGARPGAGGPVAAAASGPAGPRAGAATGTSDATTSDATTSDAATSDAGTDGGPAGGGGATAAGDAADGGAAPRPPGIDRRLLLARGLAITAGLTATGAVGWGVRTALGPPRLERVVLPLRRLPRAADGTRLAVVSDIHLGPLTGAGRTRRIVDLINSVDADVVCIVGDLVDGDVAELGPQAAPLAGIRARRGAYFVTGNHEYYSGFRQWVDELARLGVRTLRNERVELGPLDLAGVNDPGGEAFGDGPDVGRALGDRDPARPVVLMAHQPVVARDAAPYGVDLQVSGHTHGGQMVPFNLLVRLQQPVVSGLGTVDGVPVYVTDGAGFWGPPVRVGVPPEVTLVELRAP